MDTSSGRGLYRERLYIDIVGMLCGKIYLLPGELCRQLKSQLKLACKGLNGW